MVYSLLSSFGGSDKLPRKFHVNKGLLLEKSGAGTVETMLPFGNALSPCPTTSCLCGVCLKAGTVLITGWGVGGQACSLQEGGWCLEQLPEKESAGMRTCPCRRGGASCLPLFPVPCASCLRQLLWDAAAERL